MTSDTCMGCGDPILWVVTEAKGKRMPLDRDPVANGNVIVADGVATVVAPGAGTHVAHFATCSELLKFRKEKR